MSEVLTSLGQQKWRQNWRRQVKKSYSNYCKYEGIGYGKQSRQKRKKNE